MGSITSAICSECGAAHNGPGLTFCDFCRYERLYQITGLSVFAALRNEARPVRVARASTQAKGE